MSSFQAWKIDRDLVKLLLSDQEIKAKFFDEHEIFFKEVLAKEDKALNKAFYGDTL